MNSSEVIHKTFEAKQKTRKERTFLFWTFCNLVLFLILFYDLYFKCSLYTTLFQYFEYVLLAIISINLVYFFTYFSWSLARFQTVFITEDQRRLLGIKKSNPNFKIISNESNVSNKSASLSKTDVLNSSLLHLDEFNYLSKSLESNQTTQSSSWIYFNGSQESQKMFKSTDEDSIVSDQESFKKYLSDFEKNEMLMSLNNSNELRNPLWSQSSSLKYPSPISYTISTEFFDSNGCLNKSKQLNYSDVWKNLNVNNNDFTQWNENLRKWISLTIIDRLLNEIDSVNKKLSEMGLTEIQIGLSNFDRLKRTLNTVIISKHIISLKYILPFLEITQNQEYFVQRLRDLAKGGCLSEFIWNGGSLFHGKPWTDHLPTDSEIILHLIMTYLDSQLHSMAPDVNLKPFSSRYYLNEAFDKLSSKLASIYICEKSKKPPHYCLVVNKNNFDLPSGRNNLFHVLLLFLFHVKKLEHGMLGRVNLGKSGVNMLCIIEPSQ